MSQHTGSHENSLNLLGEKFLDESHWPMHRIRLLEITICFLLLSLPGDYRVTDEALLAETT